MLTKNPTKQNATSKKKSRPTCKFYQRELIEKIFLLKINDDPSAFNHILDKTTKR